MNARERFIDYVKHGGSEPFVSLQIGCGAGFDVKLAGKQWIYEGNLEDTIRAYETVECEPFYNIGLPGFGEQVPELKWQSRCEMQNEMRQTWVWLDTPYGQFEYEFREHKKSGGTPVRSPLTCDDNLDVVFWYAEQFAKGVKYVRELLSPTIEWVQKHGAVSVQWNIQPFELLGLPAVVDAVVLAMTYPERYRQACDLIRDINIEMIKEVFKSGADFVFLGGPGAEMMSPRLYEEFIVPDSAKITKVIHDVGGLVYSHICSPIEPFLTMGFYNKMGIDLFETLSPPPVGNVADLARARRILNPEMCTRGNVGLDTLLLATPEEVERVTLEVLKATEGFKHIVAASDYLFYDIPLENVQALVRTVKEYKR